MDDQSPQTLQASPNIHKKKFRENTVQVQDAQRATGSSDLFNSMKGALGARHPQLSKIIPSRRKRAIGIVSGKSNEYSES